MSTTRTRIIRRTPFIDRIKSYLNPWDFLLWLSEEMNGNDWDDFQKVWATPTGVLMNIVFMIARANTGKPRVDDVFEDYNERAGSEWIAWLASFVVHFLCLISVLNAAYTFLRKRHYRLFEASIDAAPRTQSAHRVRIESSPMSSSPFRFLSSVLAVPTAESRAHPDSAREVWELAVWDPTPLCLRLFCLFSPGHVLVYWFFLPISPADPRPSVTVIVTMMLTALMSTQLSLLHSFFSQQSKDSALIHKEVLNEYDTKFVHPALNKLVRDVSTQTFNTKTSPNSIAEVYSYTPTTYVNRGFRTNPNPRYSVHYDPDGVANIADQPQRLARSITTPNLRASTQSSLAEFSSPLRPTPALAMRQPRFSITPRSSYGADGGSFGIYNHARSPVRKPGSTYPLNERPGSPLKNESNSGAVGNVRDKNHRSGAYSRHQKYGQFRGNEHRRETDWH